MVLGTLVLAIGVGILAWISWGKGDAGLRLGPEGYGRLADAGFQQLKLGMSLDQVQAILGKGTRLADDEIPAALQERIDNPEVKGKIALVEPRGWYQWVGPEGTIFVALSETKAADRVTVVAYAKRASLKLECGNASGEKPAGAATSGKSSRPAGAAKEGDTPRKPAAAAPVPAKVKPTPEQLRQALTRENYSRLRKGMTPQQVRDILGPPVTAAQVVERHAGFESRRAVWQLGQAFIIVLFVNGKVADMDSGDGSGGPLPSANALATRPAQGPEPERPQTSYKRALLEEVRLEFRGQTVLNFVLNVGGKKINVLPWEHVKFFNADGKEIPRGNWRPYLREKKTILDVITIRMNIAELGGEVELIREWRIVKQ